MVNRLKRLLQYILLALVLSVISSCQFSSFLDDPRTATISSSQGQYGIDSGTILETLDQGDDNVFIPQTETSETIPKTPDKPIQWSQADYYRITQALHEYVWGEPLENWGLYEVFFRMECEDADYGPQFANFQVFKIGQVDEQETRIVHSLFIEPLKHSVVWHEYETIPVVDQWQTIDLEQFEITADDALQRAEINGGSKARLAVNNECSIYITAPDSIYEGWQIEYSQTNHPLLFEIHIDPTTGEYKIVSHDE